MSRLSKRPIIIPQGIKIEEIDRVVSVTGPLGKLSMRLSPKIKLKINENKIFVSSDKDQKEERMLKGLTWSMVRNMVTGVKDGFRKDLEIRGVGYQAQIKGNVVVFRMGLSHPVEYKIQEGIKISIGAKGLSISVSGIDKQLVGQIASEIRFIKPPESYKGTGIRYVGEYVIKKAGKANVAVGIGAKK
jgi:large subunit ribosomal protein L6